MTQSVATETRARNPLVDILAAVGTTALAVLGAVVLSVLVNATALAAIGSLPPVVQIGTVFAAIAVGALLTSLLFDAPFVHTFGQWYEGR